MSVLHNLVSSWYGIPSDGIFSLFKDLLLSISLRKKPAFFSLLSISLEIKTLLSERS